MKQLLTLGLLVCILTGNLFAKENHHPNIVVFLADDQGWGDVSHNGNTNLHTPNIDALVKQGVRFNRFYVGAVCAPTRAAFLTGRYHARTGTTGVSKGEERFNSDEYTIAQAFKAAGYATGAFGKWHNGTQYPNHPNAKGFDEYYGFTSGHWGHYFSPMLDHNGTFVKGKGYITNDLTSKAITFIKQQVQQDKPFFTYLPYCTPHSPMQVPDEYWDRFADKKLKMHHRDPEKEQDDHLRAALAMCENVDWNVGRVLKVLNQLGIEDDTIVLYFSDNGPNGFRWNGDMKGKKGSLDEGGVRSPFVIRWPGHIPAGREVNQVAGAIDLLPTLTDLAGIKRPEPKPIDGVSLKPLIMGQAESWPDRMIFSSLRKRVSVRTDQYRLSEKGQLFDMTKDPGQRKDLSKQKPEVTQKLKQAVADWKKSVWPHGYPTESRPFLIGYGGAKSTQLPARDAISHGGIKRSSRHPNCSFFYNWTSTEDSITWKAKVDQAGTYEAVLYYTCPADGVGSTVELSFNGSTVKGKVTKAHDPPLIGAEQDRAKRSESLVKDFKPMVLGKIKLSQGTGELTLRALQIPGKQVMDFRLLILNRVD
ncbi:Arylsulfatase [Gimesia panareensis]|uniref:Arylsulfatase n=1 Tax=Gimesia panareensis TaxID=2527978 RepID=A0A517Q463_9PLAN|nr:arylsulfatase [Gimesia panareensis]QDT26389.1 Arylsulfatase [Gimesia panareensis]